MDGILGEIGGAIAAIIIIIGVLECYFGYRIFKIQLMIVSFFLGVAVGVGVVGIAMGSGIGVGILIGVLLGALFAFLSVKIYFLGVFLFVAALSGAAGLLLTGGEQPELSVIAGIVLGIIGTFIAKHLIIISSALSGGIGIGVGLGEMAGADLGVSILISALFVASGLFVQYRAEAKQNPKKQSELPPQAPAQVVPKPQLKLPDVSSVKTKFAAMTHSSGNAQTQGAGLLCPVCGKALPTGAGFCNGCGHNMQNAAQPIHNQDEKVCPVCGKASPPGAGFCRACGHSLQ